MQGGMGSNPGQGTKIPHAAQHDPKKSKTKNEVDVKDRPSQHPQAGHQQKLTRRTDRKLSPHLPGENDSGAWTADLVASTHAVRFTSKPDTTSGPRCQREGADRLLQPPTSNVEIVSENLSCSQRWVV